MGRRRKTSMNSEHRRSRRGPSSGLDALAASINNGVEVVFVCGAGISAASGIPTFRGAGALGMYRG